MLVARERNVASIVLELSLAGDDSIHEFRGSLGSPYSEPEGTTAEDYGHIATADFQAIRAVFNPRARRTRPVAAIPKHIQWPVVVVAKRCEEEVIAQIARLAGSNATVAVAASIIGTSGVVDTVGSSSLEVSNSFAGLWAAAITLCFLSHMPPA